MDSKDELKKVAVREQGGQSRTSQSGQESAAKVRRISPARRVRHRCEAEAGAEAQRAPVTSINEYRVARAQQEPQAALQLLDEATRDVHSAASAAMKLVMLARQALGLDQLPRP